MHNIVGNQKKNGTINICFTKTWSSSVFVIISGNRNWLFMLQRAFRLSYVPRFDTLAGQQAQSRRQVNGSVSASAILCSSKIFKQIASPSICISSTVLGVHRDTGHDDR